MKSDTSPRERSTADGLILLSVALHRLTRGMWGSLPRAEPLRKIDPTELRGGSVAFTPNTRTVKKLRTKPEKLEELGWQLDRAGTLRIKPRKSKSGSVSFGPWTEYAAKRLTAAAKQGELAVYVTLNRTAPGQSCPEPTRVPLAVLARMIPRRGGLPDQPIRLTLRLAGGDEKLLEMLQEGFLVVRIEEFNDWYRSERAKGIWPSQKSRSKPKKGRPLKGTDKLRGAIMALMYEEKTSVAELRRRLVASGHQNVPSVDTLERMLDQLHRETGQEEFRRIKRLRRTHTSGQRLTAKTSVLRH